MARYRLSTPTCPGQCLLLEGPPPDRQLLNMSVVTTHEWRERRFSQGLYCPHCGSRHLHRHGRYRGRQRYRCVECGRTFNDRTLTPLHGTHYPEKWGAYARCLARGYSLRKTARLVGISLPTAFYWRHKLLAALYHGAPVPALVGIIELDEVYVLESQKGSRQLTRAPRERGTGRSVTRGPAVDRVCLLAGLDRRGGTWFELLGAGELQLFQLEEQLAGLEFRPTALCVDVRFAYWSLARRQQVPRYLFRNRFERQGLYHLGHVDRFLTRFKQWLLQFRGVATRYLGHYAHWFLCHDRAAQHGMCPSTLARELWLDAFRVPLHVTNWSVGMVMV